MTQEPAYKHLPPVFLWSFLGPRYWFTWLGLGLLWALAQLPVGVNLALGRGLGKLLYRLVPSRRRIAETNLRLCFPGWSQEQCQAAAHQVVLNCGVSFFETAMALWGPSERLKQRFQISGLEHLDAARRAGQGVILLGSHMTSLDIAGRMLAFHAQFDILYRQDPNKLMAYMLVKARESYNGDCIISVETRRMIRHLQQGRIVWYAPDQDYGAEHSLFAPFFGIPAATVTGTARFARLGKAVVIPFAHYRREDDNYEIALGAPLENFPSGQLARDCERVNQAIEEIIRHKPEQYLWVHRRFKTRPDGAPQNLYPKRKASSN